MRATIVYAVLIVGLCTVVGCSTARFGQRNADVTAPDKSDSKMEVAAASPETPVKSEDKDQPAQKPAADAVAAKPDASVKPAESKEAQADVKTASTSQPAASDENPFQPSRPAAAVSDDDKTSAAPTALADSSSVPREMNKELLLLIDRELRDATSEERIEWFDQLKHVDPAVVPEILRARRMSLQLARKSVTSQTPSDIAASTPSAPEMAAGTLTGTTGASQRNETATPGTNTVRPGIGWGNPWSGTNGSLAASDPFQIQPAGQTPTSIERGPVPANYSAPADSMDANVQNAMYRPAGPEEQNQILLRNHELPATGSNAIAHAGHVPPPQVDVAPGAVPMQSQDAAAGVAWPPPKSEVAGGGLNSVTSHLPFGTNLVQNVVGLVPGRGTTATANTGTGPITPIAATQAQLGTFQQRVEETIAVLEQELASLAPGNKTESQADYIRKHVALRLLYLMGQHQERALTAIPGIPAAEQEFWQQLIWGMVNALDTEQIPNSRDRASQTITQLNNAIRRLQEQAELEVRNVTFCHQILYFGNYEKLPRNEFSPGQEALLYAEIDHFKSEPTADGQYRTLLRSTIEILSPNGELRKQIEFPATEDLCSTYRRDYFHNYQFRIPERMPLGPHVLKLTVFDELSGKLTSYSTNFIVK